jgi:hypothetical protein
MADEVEIPDSSSLLPCSMDRTEKNESVDRTEADVNEKDPPRRLDRCLAKMN